MLSEDPTAMEIIASSVGDVAGPERTSGTTALGLEMTAGTNGAGSEMPAGTISVGPETTAGAITVKPETTAGAIAVVPEVIAGTIVVGPETAAGTIVARPETTAGTIVVGPETIAGGIVVAVPRQGHGGNVLAQPVTHTRKLVTLTHEQKRLVCRKKQETPTLTNRELAAWVQTKFGLLVHQATISRLLKRSPQLLANLSANDVRRLKVPKCPAIEEALYKWFIVAQEGRLAISDDLLVEKARQLHSFMAAKDPKLPECGFSPGWLLGFKRRHNIQMRALQGDHDSCVLSDQTWDQIVALRATLSTFDDADIFNMDETGLFFDLQPNRASRDIAVDGQKMDKSQITIGLCCNVAGNIRMPPLVINRTQNPMAFSQRRVKRPDNLGIHWYANSKVWMTASIFQDWLQRFEAHMKALGRKKVVLILDNCPAHLLGPLSNRLEITTVVFLPANTTSRFQPMDVGIIQSFKMQYRRLFIKKLLLDLEKKIPFNLDVYDAVQMTVLAWMEGVTNSTIQNCWRQTTILPNRDGHPDQCVRDLKLELPVQDPDMTEQLRELAGDMAQLNVQFPVDITVQEYVDADSVRNAPPFPVDADISTFLVEEKGVDEKEGGGKLLEAGTAQGQGDLGDELVPRMSYDVGMSIFESLKVFFEQQDYDTTELKSQLNRMQQTCVNSHMANLIDSNLPQALIPE